MATAAFRSSTKRSGIGGAVAEDAGSSNQSGSLRRSRSLSRYSGRFPHPPPESDEFPTPGSRFVNKVRGCGFTEISLDDLADEFFGARGEEEEIGQAVSRRSGRRAADAGSRVVTGSSRLRGRSVSRHHERVVPEVKAASDGSSRRRRSVSSARYRCSDSENDLDLSHSSSIQTKLMGPGSGNFRQPSLRKPTTSSHELRRSMSQKDLLQTHDSYSSHSSLTDDEAREVRSYKNGFEKTIQAVYAQEKIEHPTGDGEGTGLYEVMRKEVRHAVEEIRTELKKVMVKTEPTSIINGAGSQPKGSNNIQVIAEIRRNCTTRLEQSEKRKQELLAELAAEEQRGQELTKIVRELLPEQKQTAAPERRSRPRKRSNDRTRMSKCLTDEAERYFEDFLSNLEDTTDMSSFDGERSDTSSTLGGSAKPRDTAILNTVAESHANLRKVTSLPVETDGVVLPWLQWETSNDISPSPCKSKAGVPVVSENSLFAAAQEGSSAYDKNNHITTSLGSWSPEGNDSPPSVTKGGITGSRSGVGCQQSVRPVGGEKGLSFDMDEYLLLERDHDLVFERVRQRTRIESGSLILCGRSLI